jgi:hypothetical protein
MNPDTKQTTVKNGKPAKKLTPKQRKALKVYAETGNKTEAARAAGYSDPNANATRVFDHPEMQGAVVEIFKQLGVTETELLHPIKLALNAKRKEKVVETRKVKDGLFEMERPVEITKEVPDIELRLQGTALGTKLLGLDRGDPEYGKKMYLAGAESASQACVQLLKKLEPYLSPEANEMLDIGILEMGTADQRTEEHGCS